MQTLQISSENESSKNPASVVAIDIDFDEIKAKIEELGSESGNQANKADVAAIASKEKYLRQ